MNKPLLSIVTPTYNESENVDELYRRLLVAIAPLEERYGFEIIFIDNHSEDNTVSKLKAIAQFDRRVKIIVNVRNFGHIRSPYYGIMQSSGKATIYLASDLQDPPELISAFVSHWEAGAKVVLAVKPVAKGNQLVHGLRKAYYRALDRISDVKIVKDSTGFGLYDREVLNHVRHIGDPYPFLRGLISELGYPVTTIPFTQPRRLRGISKNNFYTLYDIAWLGIVSHSKVPIRLASFTGFAIGALSAMIAVVFFVLKLMFWDRFPVGISPIVVGVFGLFGLQLIFLGVLGEYIGTMLTYLQNWPIVVEQERVNFGPGRLTEVKQVSELSRVTASVAGIEVDEAA